MIHIKAKISYGFFKVNLIFKMLAHAIIEHSIDD